MMKKLLFLEAALICSLIALFFSSASMTKNYTRVMVENDTQVSINNAMQLTPASHALYAIGQNYPEP
jgi:hypothetical protein